MGKGRSASLEGAGAVTPGREGEGAGQDEGHRHQQRHGGAPSSVPHKPPTYKGGYNFRHKPVAFTLLDPPYQLQQQPPDMDLRSPTPLRPGIAIDEDAPTAFHNTPHIHDIPNNNQNNDNMSHYPPEQPDDIVPYHSSPSDDLLSASELRSKYMHDDEEAMTDLLGLSDFRLNIGGGGGGGGVQHVKAAAPAACDTAAALLKANRALEAAERRNAELEEIVARQRAMCAAEAEEVMRLREQRNDAIARMSGMEKDITQVASDCIAAQSKLQTVEARARDQHAEIIKINRELEECTTHATLLEEENANMKQREANWQQQARTQLHAINMLQLEVQAAKEALRLLREDANQAASEMEQAHERDEAAVSSAVQALASEHALMAQRYRSEAEQRRALYNQVIEMKGNIRVFCRCRPMLPSELARGLSDATEFDPLRPNDITVRMASGLRKTFRFDRVFAPNVDQSGVFEDTKPVVVSVLDGYNVCIFAFGQTGTGKTFTMEGPPGQRGVNHRTLEEMFRIVREERASGEVDFTISVSLLEVYNEMLRDLSASSSTDKLEIKQGPEGVFVKGLTETTVETMAEVWEVLVAGSKVRAAAATNANEHSSRSHSLLCVKVVGRNRLTGVTTRGKLWLVDLAGSERVARSEATGERLREAQHINKSLSALGDVIAALTQGGAAGKGANNGQHVPYRNSKLTHLLQDSLGTSVPAFLRPYYCGEAKALMFVQISPSEADCSETLCSLNFASRVRGVELGPARRTVEAGNEVVVLKQEAKEKEDAMKRLEETVGRA
eukprot:jgi/Chlat1/4593/Chrsp290S04351